MKPWLTSVIAIIGSVVAAYFTALFTSRMQYKHQKSKENREVKDKFLEAFDLMPELILEMHKDFNSESMSNTRELVILPSKNVLYNNTNPIFQYYSDNHEDLNGKLNILLNYNFIEDLTTSDTQKYRISEFFFKSVKEYKPKI
jgi:hypothetical protein